MARSSLRCRVIVGAILLVLLTLAVGACASTEKSAAPSASSTTLPNGARRGTMTEITNPAGVGPVLGTDYRGGEIRVIDVANFCNGYEEFHTFRTAYLAQLQSVTELTTLRTWVSANYRSGEAGAKKIHQSVGMGDVGMLPVTFAINSDERFHQDQDLDDMRQNANEESTRLERFDAAAAEVC